MRINLKNSLYFISCGSIAFVLLVYDWIRISINLDDPVLNVIRDLFSIIVLVLLYAAMVSFFNFRKHKKPLEILRQLIAYGFFSAAIISTWGIILENKGNVAGKFVPQNVLQLLATTAFAFGIAAFIVVLMTLISQMIYIKPEKKVRRRFQLFIAVSISASVLSVFRNSSFARTIFDIALGLSILIALLHIVSMNWIVFLTRKEKYKSLGQSFSLMLLFGYSYASVGPADLAGGVLQFYSTPLQEFAKLTFLFLTIYFSIALVVTMFHIPTSGAFEKKKRELDSYQNLSKVIANVLDPSEVMNNTVAVVGTVTGASKVWIELNTDVRNRKSDGGSSFSNFRIMATYKTSEYELSGFDFDKVRRAVSGSLSKGQIKCAMVQSENDLEEYGLRNFPARSLIAVPLIAHENFIGILYGAHEMGHAFDEEEISTVHAFADTAAVAIQNSFLFKESLENERLQHELHIAHEVQLKLLPTSFPRSDKFESDFLAFPAFEVGGDYIDYCQIEEGKYAFVVADVSGKGTSAAFYMAYLKGIFQSLCTSTRSPIQFIIAANEAVCNTLQKNFFISLIYSVLDSRTGEVSLVRAGHTPAIWVRNGGCRLIKPSGVALGLEKTSSFTKHIEEEKVSLESGDALVFYTDGITDQRDQNGKEFGEERFWDLIRDLGSKSAEEIKGGVIRALAEFSQGTDPVDDTTMLILKWK
jgi:sigma-B regulation protein RsbU (phosphoserine phosphatase)